MSETIKTSNLSQKDFDAAEDLKREAEEKIAAGKLSPEDAADEQRALLDMTVGDAKKLNVENIETPSSTVTISLGQKATEIIPTISAGDKSLVNTDDQLAIYRGNAPFDNVNFKR